jgi:cell wall assembly regulator SMI1
MRIFKRKPAKFDNLITTNDLLSAEEQVSVAKDQALLATLEMVAWQTEAWNELVERLAGNGLLISFSPEQKSHYTMLMKRLEASMTVMAQSANIPQEIIERLGFANE